jgi:hypothetical protein
MSLEITGFTTNLIDCVSSLGGDCCPIDPTLIVKPWAYQIDTHGGTDNCDFIVKRRPEKGWTLDFVFNRESQPWSNGGPFYFIGARDEHSAPLYADNNLSFRFTSDGRIEWRAYRYSGECINEVYQESYYIDSGVTPVLCYNGTLKDFNITIVFDRHLRLTECDIENSGGWNDMITGETITNAQGVVLSGETEQRVYIEELNKDWNDERYARLGTLKIYLNGRPIYKKTDWEEVIPSTRGFQPFIQLWGGGASGSGGIHTGSNLFNLKRLKYMEEPLNFVNVYHHYIVSTKPYYDINECNEECVDTITAYTDRALLTNENEFILVDGDDTIIF